MVKRILIVSDSHGKTDLVLAALDAEKPVDYLLHAGDAQGGEGRIEEFARCPVHMVAGNCDFFSRLPSVKIVEICGRKFLLCHGHQYQVSSMGSRTIREKAREYGCSVAVCGHTHRPLVEEEGEVLVLNPGSIASPRQASREKTYLVLDMEEDGQIRSINLRSL